MKKFIFGILSILLTSTLFSFPVVAAESDAQTNVIQIQFDDTKREEAEKLTVFLSEHLIIENQELVLTATNYDNIEQYENVKSLISEMNRNSKETNQEFYYDETGSILLRERQVQMSSLAFTNRYRWGYTTSFNRKDCEKIATYLKIGVGIASIVALIGSKVIVGIPIAAISGVAGAILSIGVVIFEAGARNRGIDMSYTSAGAPIWFKINW